MRSHMARGCIEVIDGGYITTLACKWGSRLLKAVWFALISFLLGRTLGPSTAYINHDVATAICGFIYGDINAETMYETYTNIDILILLTSATIVCLITLKIFNKTRNH